MTRILCVCLGNICRSPTAEAVLRALAAQEARSLTLEVDSAGTADYHIGEPPDRRSQAAAKARGYDLSALRARQVVRSDFERFDWLLAMDRANLVALEQQAPAAMRGKIKLFLSFAPGCGYAEMPDPYYGNADDFTRVVDLAEQGARGLLGALLSPGPAR